MPKTPNNPNVNKNNNNSQNPYYNKLNQFYYKHFHNRTSQFKQFALPNNFEQANFQNLPNRTHNENWYQDNQIVQGDEINTNAQQEFVECIQEPIEGYSVEDPAFQKGLIEEEYDYCKEEEKEQSLLTPEMIKIFQHSENWRIEKEKILQQEKIREETYEYIDKEDCLPKELPSFKTYTELYSSKNAIGIASLESQLDNQFREACESDNPILWPILPINLKFA